MSAEDGRAAGALRLEATAHVEKGQVLLVPGDGGRRQQARRTVARMGAADRAEGVGGAVHEVGPRPAVDVQVHETR